jgi:hypothetical protein
MVEMNPVLPISQQCRLLAGAALVSLPQAGRGQCAGSCDHCADRTALSGSPLLRLAPDRGVVGDPSHSVNRKGVQRLMRLLGLAAIYQCPNTSKPAAAQKVYPYLLGGLAIDPELTPR